MMYHCFWGWCVTDCWKFSRPLEYLKRVNLLKQIFKVSTRIWKPCKMKACSVLLARNAIPHYSPTTSGAPISRGSYSLYVSKFSSNTTFSTNSPHIHLAPLKSVLFFKCPCYYLYLSWGRFIPLYYVHLNPCLICPTWFQEFLHIRSIIWFIFESFTGLK